MDSFLQKENVMEKAPVIVNAEVEKLAIEAGRCAGVSEAGTCTARGLAKILRNSIEGSNDPQLTTRIGDLADALDRATFGPRTGVMTPERERAAEENKRLHEDAVTADDAARRRANTPQPGDTLVAAAERERAAREAKDREEARLRATQTGHR